MVINIRYLPPPHELRPFYEFRPFINDIELFKPPIVDIQKDDPCLGAAVLTRGCTPQQRLSNVGEYSTEPVEPKTVIIASTAPMLVPLLAGTAGATVVLGGVSAGAVFLFGGCTTSDDLPQEETPGKNCASIFSPLPKAEDWPNEKIYLNKDTYVVADNKITETTAQFYLQKFPQATQSILNLFGIDSPWKNHFGIILLDGTSHPAVDPDVCGVTAVACAKMGTAIFPYSDLENINANAYLNELFRPSTFYHELSHVMRAGVARPWRGLEEGLAVYTQIYTAEGAQGELSYAAEDVFSEKIKAGQYISIQLPGIKKIMVVTEGYPKMDVYFTDDLNKSWVISTIFPGQAIMLTSKHILKVTGNPYTPDITIYERFGDPSKNLDVASSGVECGDDTYKERLTIKTTDGKNIHFDNAAVLYSKLDSFENDIQLTWGNYITNFCFWETLRKNYGSGAIKGMVQSMIEFSKQHQPSLACYSTPTNFPFFQIFRDVTQMSEAEAIEYFDRFSAPTDDKWYPLGGIAWDEK